VELKKPYDYNRIFEAAGIEFALVGEMHTRS